MIEDGFAEIANTHLERSQHALPIRTSEDSSRSGTSTDNRGKEIGVVMNTEIHSQPLYFQREPLTHPPFPISPSKDDGISTQPGTNGSAAGSPSRARTRASV
jgi:hypothetical protein